MKKQLVFHSKAIDIDVTRNANSQSQQLNSILIIEIQIYFSCLLGKRLAFYSTDELEGVYQLEQNAFSDILKDTQQLTTNIYIRFNTVMTKTCAVSNHIGPPPVTDFEIKNQKPYVPSWLNIDYNNGLWCGQYGWQASDRNYKNTKQVRRKASTDKQ